MYSFCRAGRCSKGGSYIRRQIHGHQRQRHALSTALMISSEAAPGEGHAGLRK